MEWFLKTASVDEKKKNRREIDRQESRICKEAEDRVPSRGGFSL